MRRLRSSMVLLATCVVAILAAWVRLATERPELPTGSSYSQQADGAEALFLWAEGEGAAPLRLEEARPFSTDTPRVLLVLQPESVVLPREERIFSAVAQGGGTLVLAGDSLLLRMYARELDITVEPAQVASSAVAPNHGLELPIFASNRVRADDAEPLLVAPNGDWIALRKPYLSGWVVAIATASPFTNAGLRDPQTARFVYRELLAPAVGGGLAFDEIHHADPPPTDSADEPSVNQLLFATAPGQAIVAASVLIFLYLLLAGRRLGPALPPRPPAAMRRTMFEHVQMLAGLYRRAAHLGLVRSTLRRHYARILARGSLPADRSAVLRDALARIEGARSEQELVAAVAQADDVLSRA